MPTYIVLRIGCLCCDTPTSIVGFYKNEEKAFDIIEKCEKINTSSRHEYQLHVIDDYDEYESKHLKRILSFYESRNEKENNEYKDDNNTSNCTKYTISKTLLD